MVELNQCLKICILSRKSFQTKTKCKDLQPLIYMLQEQKKGRHNQS